MGKWRGGQRRAKRGSYNQRSEREPHAPGFPESPPTQAGQQGSLGAHWADPASPASRGPGTSDRLGLSRERWMTGQPTEGTPWGQWKPQAYWLLLLTIKKKAPPVFGGRGRAYPTWQKCSERHPVRLPAHPSWEYPLCLDPVTSNKSPQAGWLRRTDVLSHSSGGQKAEIKVSVGLYSLRNFRE